MCDKTAKRDCFEDFSKLQAAEVADRNVETMLWRLHIERPIYEFQARLYLINDVTIRLNQRFIRSPHETV